MFHYINDIFVKFNKVVNQSLNYVSTHHTGALNAKFAGKRSVVPPMLKLEALPITLRLTQ